MKYTRTSMVAGVGAGVVEVGGREVDGEVVGGLVAGAVVTAVGGLLVVEV